MGDLKFVRFIFWITVSVLLFATPAHAYSPTFAYIDPNATSLIAQLIGPLVVIVATFVTFLRKQLSAAIHWFVNLVTTGSPQSNDRQQ